MIQPVIRGFGCAVPPRCYRQEEIYTILSPYLPNAQRAGAVFANAGIGARYLAVAGDFYQEERTTQQRNERYMTEAVALSEQAIARCLESAGLSVGEIDHLIIVSCTGIDTPGLDLHLAGSMGMSPWLRRTNVLGMGCYGAFPGMLRAREAVVAQPGSTALVAAVEVCSLHFQPGDTSMENIVSSALFADGAAALLVDSRPEASRWPTLIDSATFSDYQTFDDMAFHLTDHGFRMSLSAYVPRLLAAKVEEFVDTVLGRNGLERSQVRHWVVHPGSSKILDHVQDRLGLCPEQLHASRRVLQNYGNMSSATVLFVLDEVQRFDDPQAGDFGMLMSFGPGLTMECALVRWHGKGG